MFKKSGYIEEMVLYGMDGYHTVEVVCSNFVKFFETINHGRILAKMMMMMIKA